MIASVTVDLVRMPSQKAKVWHIVAIPDGEATLCSWAIPRQALREYSFDAHVISYRGRPVCSRCRKALR